MDTLVKDLGLEAGKTAATPRAKRDIVAIGRAESSEEPQRVRATLFRSGAMLAAYVAQDRVDIAETVKCLTTCMSRPRETHLAELKRLIRYLASSRRCHLVYPRQRVEESRLRVHVDSDWAGDLVGRRSASGVVVRRGARLLRHMSTLQTSIGLSSAESEFYALTRGACTALGVQSNLQDWGKDARIEAYIDSSSARVVSPRTGLGSRLRHLQTRHLWLQERGAKGQLSVHCVRGAENPADALPKVLP